MLTQIRKNSFKPVLILSHETDNSGKPNECTKALNSGADNYISYPFDPDELVARVNAILRRTDSTTISESNNCIEDDVGVYDRSLDVQISRLRKKLSYENLENKTVSIYEVKVTDLLGLQND